MKPPIYLNYLHSCIEVTVDLRTPDNIYDVLDFFSSYLEATDAPKTKPLAAMNVIPYELYDWEALDSGLFIEWKTMRTSTAPEFNLKSRLFRLGDDEHFIADETRTNIVMNKQENRVDVYFSTESSIQLIELIRDLIVKNEESQGTLILHASAVLVEDSGIAVVGSKGSGKSTMLLELLSAGDCSLISGDKCFITVTDDRLRINGWPDYPHLGAGTVARFPALRSLVEDVYGLDAATMHPDKKILIDPARFAETLSIRFGRGDYALDTCIFPRFDSASDGSTLTSVKHGGADRLLDNLMFSTDYYQTKWHRFIEPDYKKTKRNIEKMNTLLRGITFWEFTGDLKIGASFFEEVST